jgi:hypothetical protein
MAFEVEENNLIIKFTNPKIAEHFKAWLCGAGEQYYWTWMECREEEEEGDITALDFDYQNGNVIETKCGRLS